MNVVTLLHRPPTGERLERSLSAADYARAEGLIDVFEGDRLVRSCRFTHDNRADELWTRCSVTGLAYHERHGRGELSCLDGRTLRASVAGGPRDIPHWLLLPFHAPIWGRPDDGWQPDTERAELSLTGRLRVPLRSVETGEIDGHADVEWPQAYLTQLQIADELYVLRGLELTDRG